MRNLLLATALIVLPMTVSAQETGKAEMEQGLSMLEIGASRVLSRYNVDADVMALTLGQLAEIKDIAGGSDMQNEKRRIERALAR